MRAPSRSLRWPAWLAAAFCGLWLGGLGWFVVSGLLLRPGPMRATDAVVVLTGGRARIETGVAVLAQGMAKKLFISGVNQQVDRAVLLRALGPQAERDAGSIVLGREADNTFGNARETANWMREKRYRSLRLVTSWYHMRRSLLEFRRAMPEIEIIAHPVFALRLEPERWWGRHGILVLVVGEYGKYLAAWLRPLLLPVLPARIAFGDDPP